MRKQPSQARSRATVDAIVTAGARVLAEHGPKGFTTNKTADVAGVSIGSLYQYFPNKAALMDAIKARHLDDILAVLQKTEPREKPFEQRIIDLVDGMIAAHSLQPALHRVLLDQVPRHDSARPPNAGFEKDYQARYKALIAAAPTQKDDAELDLRVQVLSSAIEGVVHAAVQNGTVRSPAFRQELLHLVRAYLGSPYP